MRKSLVITLIITTFLFPVISLANGGDQRIVAGGKYYVNLSRAPFTPQVGTKESMLVSFFDVQANRLIAADLIVRIRISRLGGAGSVKRTFLFEQNNVKVQGGVLEFPYTFSETGLHEVYFDFAFASNPTKVYEVPDFLIDVQKLETPPPSSVPTWLIGAIGLVIGLTVGLFLGKKKNRLS